MVKAPAPLCSLRTVRLQIPTEFTLRSARVFRELLSLNRRRDCAGLASSPMTIHGYDMLRYRSLDTEMKCELRRMFGNGFIVWFRQQLNMPAGVLLHHHFEKQP